MCPFKYTLFSFTYYLKHGKLECPLFLLVLYNVYYTQCVNTDINAHALCESGGGGAWLRRSIFKITFKMVHSEGCFNLFPGK